jgi:3D (Asp-Asp-Asp) domain-containing protein
MKSWGLCFILSLAITGFGCAGRESKSNDRKSGYVPLSEAEAKVYTTPTIYYVPQYDLTKQACSASERTPLKDKHDVTLFEICPQTYSSCLMQGTCSLKNGQGEFLVNVAGRSADGKQRFSRVGNKVCRYGYGAKRNICLDPFHSIAADLSIYQLGQVIYIPSLVGVNLPDGTRHDGYFIVRDSGGAIKGYGRFDFFTGFWSNIRSNPFAKVGLSDKSTHPQYYVLDDSEASEILKKRNYPELPVDN